MPRWHFSHDFPSPPPPDKVIRHRACSLKDTAHAIFASELDPEFGRMCDEIKEARRKRGEKTGVGSETVVGVNAADTKYIYSRYDNADISCSLFILFIASSLFIYRCTFSSHFKFGLITDARRRTAPSHGGVGQLQSVHLSAKLAMIFYVARHSTAFFIFTPLINFSGIDFFF